MLFLVAAAVLATSPRALPDAESGVHIPRLDGMGGVLSFMTRAGEHSVMFRPSSWFADAHPIFYLDFSRPQSLKEVGIDPAGAATLSSRKNGRMTCHQVNDPALFDQRAKQRLEVLGKPWEGKVQGLLALGATTVDGALVAAVVRRGNVACAVGSRTDARPLLAPAATATGTPRPKGQWAQLRGLRGELFIVSGQAALGLTGNADALEVDGRVRGLALPGLVTGSVSPYAGMQPQALFHARAAVRPQEIPSALRSLTRPISELCRTCPKEGVAALERALGAQLTGQVALVVESAQVRGRLRTQADRYFAARHVWLAEVKDEAATRRALLAISSWEGGREEEGQWVIPVEGREVRVGLSGRHLFFANDTGALKAALVALPQRPGKQGAGLELALDPALAARTLSQVSLMDVLGSKELAGLFAVSTEVGPVLGITRSVQARADSEKGPGHRVRLSWKLVPAL